MRIRHFKFSEKFEGKFWEGKVGGKFSEGFFWWEIDNIYFRLELPAF